MKIKSITFLLAYLILFILAIPAIACDCEGDPPGDCYLCLDGYWIHYGDCWYCQDCKSCVNCWCACTSQCCKDSDCGPPACWNCVNCQCESQCNPSDCEECITWGGYSFCVDKCDYANCKSCDGNGSCVYICDECTECVPPGVCVYCNPYGGSLCSFTSPAIGIGCGHPSDSYRCYDAGDICEWVQTSLPDYNATCKCCNLNSTYCVKMRPRFCYDKIVIIPLPGIYCTCDDTFVGSEIAVGSRTICPQM